MQARRECHLPLTAVSELSLDHRTSCAHARRVLPRPVSPTSVISSPSGHVFCTITGPYVEVHGALDRMFCMACQSEPVRMPPHLLSEAGQKLTPEQAAQLKCPTCLGWMRPHVMWFDESYDNRYFPLDHVFDKIAKAELVITAGTSGGTNLPWLVAEAAAWAEAPLVDINPEGSPFLAKHEQVVELRGGAEQWLPQIVEWMQAALGVHVADAQGSSGLRQSTPSDL